MFDTQHITLESFCSSKNVVHLSIKIHSTVTTSAALKLELGTILVTFIPASSDHTHDQPQLNNQDCSLQMKEVWLAPYLPYSESHLKISFIRGLATSTMEHLHFLI